jgi:hypothetical protein
VDFYEARDLFGIIFQIPGPNCKFLDCGLIFGKAEGPKCKMPEIRISRNYFPKGNPWTTGAPVHHGLASIADRRSSSELGLRALRSRGSPEVDEELARVRSRASPEVEERRGGRATAVPNQRQRRSMRAMLKRGEKRREAGRGAVKPRGGARLL